MALIDSILKNDQSSPGTLVQEKEKVLEIEKVLFLPHLVAKEERTEMQEESLWKREDEGLREGLDEVVLD